MSLEAWLNKTINEENVHGVLVIDNKIGLSLGSRGVADNDDAPQIKWLVDQNAAASDSGVLTLKHRDSIVYITKEGSILLAVYKPASQKALSTSGSSPSSQYAL